MYVQREREKERDAWLRAELTRALTGRTVNCYHVIIIRRARSSQGKFFGLSLPGSRAISATLSFFPRL